jgi:hypothetical protein
MHPNKNCNLTQSPRKRLESCFSIIAYSSKRSSKQLALEYNHIIHHYVKAYKNYFKVCEIIKRLCATLYTSTMYLICKIKSV